MSIFSHKNINFPKFLFTFCSHSSTGPFFDNTQTWKSIITIHFIYFIALRIIIIKYITNELLQSTFTIKKLASGPSMSTLTFSSNKLGNDKTSEMNQRTGTAYQITEVISKQSNVFN